VACSFGQFRAWFRGNPTKHDLVRSPNPTVTADTTEPAQTCPPMTPIYPGCQHGESSTIECTAMRASDQEYATERFHWVRLQFSCSLSPLPHAPPLLPLAPAVYISAVPSRPCRIYLRCSLSPLPHAPMHHGPLLHTLTPAQRHVQRHVSAPCQCSSLSDPCVHIHVHARARACAYKHKRTRMQKHPHAEAFACTRPSSRAHPCPCACMYRCAHELFQLVYTSLPAWMLPSSSKLPSACSDAL